MRQILVVNSSVSGDASVSRALVNHAVQCLMKADPESVVVLRDLSHAPVPHLTPSTAAGVRAVAGTDDEVATKKLSDELIDELRHADLIVIGAPMYNFSIPSTLRAWFDHVLRPQVTFAYSEDGPRGLLTDKRAIVIEPRGGFYSEGAAKALDFQEPYLRQLLSFMGITDVSFVRAEKIAFGPEARNAAIAAAHLQIERIVTRIASPSDALVSAALPPDYDSIMQTNLSRVFGERDPTRRLGAIRDLYAVDAILHEPHHSAQGHDAISQAVTDLLAQMPADFSFQSMRPALGHNGVGRLQWAGGQPGRPPAVTGLDVAHVEDGVIRTLHVFIDPSGA